MIEKNIKFIEKANLIHNNKYDYSKVIFRSVNKKVEIICAIHGIFKQIPKKHLKGQGCRACSGKLKLTVKSFIEKAISKHQLKYNYSKVDYKNNSIKVIIICPIHGEFLQTPRSHLSGHGCSVCGNVKRHSTIDYIYLANIKHDFKYNYLKTIYISARKKIIITCKDHGDFEQQAAGHLNGQGCSKCSHFISKPEEKWLNKLNIPLKNRHKTLKLHNKKFNVDGFDPATNTVYEFYGDFWHGNPKIYDLDEVNKATKTTFGQLYQKTLKKENILKNAGYKLVTIWESDFKESDKVI